ncbi:MAG: hypothetical protein QNJ84_02640 [Alphaproteobacteria bacterium]|nr:hypothetical protein [Alphaproteobacteria bacterium]
MFRKLIVGFAAVIAIAGCAGTRPPIDPSVSAADVGGAEKSGRINCLDQGVGVLAGLGFDPADVISIDGIVQTYESRGDRKPKGYDLWFRFRDRPGALVVNHNLICDPFSYYTRGELTVPNPPAA